VADPWPVRRSLALAVTSSAPLLGADDLHAFVTFLLSDGLADRHEAVRQQMLEVRGRRAASFYIGPAQRGRERERGQHTINMDEDRLLTCRAIQPTAHAFCLHGLCVVGHGGCSAHAGGPGGDEGAGRCARQHALAHS
jgi:hypothetical protein